MTQDDGQADDLAAPLDAMLAAASEGTFRRFIPGVATAKMMGSLATKPNAVRLRMSETAIELTKIAVGNSQVAASRRDRRFVDPAWRHNPFLHRLMQSYLVAGQTAEELVRLADLDWHDDRRVTFMVLNLTEALSPSNFPLINPSSARAALEYGGLNLLKGASNFVTDMSSSPRIPQMVDPSGFRVGDNVGATAGSVVFRNEVFELIQYMPQTKRVGTVPLVIVPPTINKFYVLDLAPGRSLIEHLVQDGQQVFIMSWRNPDRRHASWGIDTYVDATIEALDAAARASGATTALLAGACSGGIIASATASYLQETGREDRLAGLTLLVTVLDNAKAGDSTAFASKAMLDAAKRMSRRKGYLSGTALAEMFAWLRPGDLIWNYWVNNYLLGLKPPAFDILFWNSDTTRMPAQLHSDFIDIASENSMTRAGVLHIHDTPIDLARVKTDNYVVAGIADHITPWQNCYRSVALLGGNSRFVLSTSGHIAALVNPPSNEKATYQVNHDLPEDAEAWLRDADRLPGSWWPDWLAWLRDRRGPEMTAPKSLGGGSELLAEAPGTYVFDH